MKENDLCIIIPDSLERRTKIKTKTKKKAVSIIDNILHFHDSSFLSKHFQKHRPTVLTTLWSPSLRTNFNGAVLHFSRLEKKTWSKWCLRPMQWWTHFWLKSPSQQQRTQRPAVSSSTPFPVPRGETRARVLLIPGKYRLWSPSCGAMFLLPFWKKKIKKNHPLFRVCPFGVGENEFSFSCNFKHAKMLEA